MNSAAPSRFFRSFWSTVFGSQGRQSSSFVRDAYINITQQSSNMPKEAPLYSELSVREWLQGFKGGKVHVEKNLETGVVSVILDYPERKNALSGEMMVQLSDVICDLETWSNGRILILRGSGGQFCSGGDLKFVRRIADPLSGSKMSIFMQSVTGRLHRLQLISFAVVEGHALGGGAELASACDFRLLDSNAKIGFVQARLGVNTGWGGGTHLTRQIGVRNALRLLAGGETLDAQAAFKMGLADEIIEAKDESELTKKVLAHVQPILDGAPDAVKAFKRIVINADQCPYTEAMNRERDIFSQSWGSPAHLKALEKLSAK